MKWLACVTIIAVGGATQTLAELSYTQLSFADLNGWEDDDHAEALDVFTQTCTDIERDGWASLCTLAKTGPDPKAFFETFFEPVLIEDGDEMLFTGYFEPEIEGRLSPSERFRFPLYRLPPEISDGIPFSTRREIEEDGVLVDRGLEIAWVADPVDLFFLQVQGSGRIRLPEGETLRVGYAGKNGREYSSIGAELVRRGIFEDHQVSAEVIRNWVARNPEDGQALLWTNDSYVFFRELTDVPKERGPLGAMNRSITPMRSIAVDPAITLLGAPVWIEKEGEAPMNKLMIAQDTGSAIKGAQRADIFFGTGNRAGRAAGRIKDSGRMVVLMPVQYALSKLDNDPL